MSSYRQIRRQTRRARRVGLQPIVVIESPFPVPPGVLLARLAWRYRSEIAPATKAGAVLTAAWWLFRALQQFFKWHATEDPDEPRPNPVANLKPPKVGDKLIPVFTEDELAAMLATCKGGGFQNRRDYAIISLFKDAGIRLSELAGLGLDDVSPASREATVTGKGDKQRTVRFTYDTARALDRYLRERAKHPMARVSALWLGVRGGPMTASGVYQMIERRGREAGVEVNPHKFRHTFSHNWLDNGGAEGDLMELNGWSSPQMLARYGRSARSARARRHYDDVMGD